jgi:hypothetical protein
MPSPILVRRFPARPAMITDVANGKELAVAR